MFRRAVIIPGSNTRSVEVLIYRLRWRFVIIWSELSRRAAVIRAVQCSVLYVTEVRETAVN